jgi:hypothetical protein
VIVKFGVNYASVAVFGPTVTNPKAIALSLAKIILAKPGG